jgi:hypothetical protein
MYTKAMIAALLGCAEAGRIPLKYNPMNIADYHYQKNVYALRSGVEMPRLGGEQIPVIDKYNTQYFIDIELGSNKQQFQVVPDTGSSNLWVYAAECKSVACLTHKQFDDKASTTFVENGEAFDITYGSGSVNGVVGQDNCWIGDIEANMEFGLIKKTSGPTFVVSKMDGIIGLGFETISVDKLPVFMDASGLTDESFAFYLKETTEESYMTMPGIDESLGLEKIATHNVIEETYWNLNITKMEGPNGVQELSGWKAAIDSGTSLIVGPDQLVNPLVEGITVNKDCSGTEGLPDITFTFDDVDYVLTKDDYVVKAVSGSTTQCVMGIMGMGEAPEDFKYLIVGDNFFRKFAPYFNKNDKTVTFYKM